MAKHIKHEAKTVVGVGVNSVGIFFGTFWSIVGLVIAVGHSLRGTVAFAQETQSILTGLTFGLAAGIVAVIVVPLAYFALGWVVGALYGLLFNAVATSSGGIQVKLADDVEVKSKK